MTGFGAQTMVGELRGVIVKRPAEAFIDQATVNAQWQALNYFGQPDFDLAAAQHAQFVQLLNGAGAEVVHLPHTADTGLDSVYVHDPVAAVCTRGAILANMGKPLRRGEPAALATVFQQLNVPVLGQINGEGMIEGGDVVWVDERSVAVGEGYRSNAEGIRQLRALLGEAVDEVIAVPLPHWTGPDDCLHLQSFISLLNHKLALVYSRLMPVPFRQALLARGFTLIEVPDSEYDSMACNVLAVAPRKVIAVAGNPITQSRMEAAGVDVMTYAGSDISLKGAGGPTCLTRPFWRGL
jgi:N-dimethylarginine dimethylaminohydrolase